MRLAADAKSKLCVLYELNNTVWRPSGHPKSRPEPIKGLVVSGVQGD
jgi:hypothetical protein